MISELVITTSYLKKNNPTGKREKKDNKFDNSFAYFPQCKFEKMAVAPKKEGEVPEITWRFKNTGDKPLVVINAAGTCGCTVAEKPEQPVAPGETGVIKAKFSSEGRVGPNNKQVVVTTNTKGNTTTALGFTVTVEKQ